MPPASGIIRIENEHLMADVAPAGGLVWRWLGRTADGLVPLMREPSGPRGTEASGRDPLHAACFPLVPFGNRVRGNAFAFGGRTHTLAPNVAFDRHYLHGDGWTSLWSVAEHAADRVSLALSHAAAGTPYSYDADQVIALQDRSLCLTLAVTNRGGEALPFGLGWHPYFPLTPATVLRARAAALWDEDEHWLPTTRRPVGGDLDFAEGRPLPRRWINTVFEGWDGRAAIEQGDAGPRIAVEADRLFGRYLVFLSDPPVDPDDAGEVFCFEPMSHGADAHNQPDGGGLKRLAPGESLSGSVRFTWERL